MTETHADQAVRDLEHERALLDDMRQHMLRTISQLQVEESDLLAQMSALSVPTSTVGLRDALHAEMFGSNQQAPRQPEARTILDALVAQPEQGQGGDAGALGEAEEDEDDDDLWFTTQQSLRNIEAARGD
ncbi:hypothetical protein KFE25_000692 [Diacronema lutheri]|uniref:Uncharacterized protein n=1 Tax=Diacronema lutheri TaxID=2081491 RepID=A0A8J6CDR9_DIALT|nr:hypothetical protein KFE25_000692 [Diacronema lutheri]